MCVCGGGSGRRQGGDNNEQNTQPMTRAEAPTASGSPWAITQGPPEKGPRAPPLVFLLGISCRTIWNTFPRPQEAGYMHREAQLPSPRRCQPTDPWMTVGRGQATSRCSVTASSREGQRGRVNTSGACCKPASLEACAWVLVSRIQLPTAGHSPTPAVWVCPLTRNRTRDLAVFRMTPTNRATLSRAAGHLSARAQLPFQTKPRAENLSVYPSRQSRPCRCQSLYPPLPTPFPFHSYLLRIWEGTLYMYITFYFLKGEGVGM